MLVRRHAGRLQAAPHVDVADVVGHRRAARAARDRRHKRNARQTDDLRAVSASDSVDAHEPAPAAQSPLVRCLQFPSVNNTSSKMLTENDAPNWP